MDNSGELFVLQSRPSYPDSGSSRGKIEVDDAATPIPFQAGIASRGGCRAVWVVKDDEEYEAVPRMQSWWHPSFT
jgi:hypothetical protein